MRGGLDCSVKTRLVPVMDVLHARRDDWVRTLLALSDGSIGDPVPGRAADVNLSYQKGFWGKNESPLDPPVALLSWLIRHPPAAAITDISYRDRWLLGRSDPAVVRRALRDLRSGAPKGWHLFDSPVVPDVLIETPDAIVVIESKRGTVTPALDESALPGRPLIWRSLDAAWEVRGKRRVFGFFIVEGQDTDGSVPQHWRESLVALHSEECLNLSFPHRSTAERAEIAGCLTGLTTWQAVCQTFAIAQNALPRTIQDLPYAGAGS